MPIDTFPGFRTHLNKLAVVIGRSIAAMLVKVLTYLFINTTYEIIDYVFPSPRRKGRGCTSKKTPGFVGH